MANRYFYRTMNTLHVVPTLIDCNFVVDSANTNGLGIRSLKGPGVANVFGYTSATPAAGNNLVAGQFLVQFQDVYNRYYGGFSGFVSPLSGSSVAVTSGLSKGKAYVITSVGTTTLAEWQTLGVIPGIAPAPGVSFVAATASAGTGSGTVQATIPSNVLSIEVVGDPNLTLGSTQAPANGALNGTPGGFILLSCYGLPASGQVPALTAPADGSVMGCTFYLSNSSVQVAGE